MSDVAIRAEGLSKLYRLGVRERYRTLRDTLTDTLAAPFRRRNGHASSTENPETFWALKDVSFEVKHGEVIGIIGRNGAGKSTLLKVLSRITEPTCGEAHIHGRIASLLEVGTGFHPELTGRDNIYLNGAILGMKKAEIRRKFDEIVAFAEVEKFIDTPVKHYSSGMYVRLAFAVAAHLEPEILIVDEVLAVGDQAFQRKCLGKMEDASRLEGRTILFVSHNMAAVKSLTNRGVVLSRGQIAFDGATELAIQAYIQRLDKHLANRSREGWGKGEHTAIGAVRLVDMAGSETSRYVPGEPLQVEVTFETDGALGMSLEVFLVDASDSRIGMASTHQFHGQVLPPAKGAYICRMDLEPIWLASGRYSLEVRTSVVNVAWDHSVEDALEFEVPFSNPLGHQFDFKQASGYGCIALLSSPPARFESIPTYELDEIQLCNGRFEGTPF